MARATLGVLFGNRGFFPDYLVEVARGDVQKLFKEMDLGSVMLDESQTRLGSVQSYDDAMKCAEVWKESKDPIDGIVIFLPNFGDEKGAVDAIRHSGLDVPVLVQASPDDPGKLGVEDRRDAYCGKISVCNSLTQYGIPFSLTGKHTERIDSAEFREDLDEFVSVCRVANSMRNVRVGAIGARPEGFNTVRYSEKILQANGITVVTLDLSEVISGIKKLGDADKPVVEKIDVIKSYADVGKTPDRAITTMGKLFVVLENWIRDYHIDATALQCWTSVQESIGINVCTVMSILSEHLQPSACEVDVAGALSMYALQCASGKPGNLVDWNNNYRDDHDKCVLFHCGNWPKSCMDKCVIADAPILGTTVGTENTCGALAGRMPAGPLTFCRVSTSDLEGEIIAYVGQGETTNDKLDTFGCRAVARIPDLQELMRVICTNGFEHHVATNPSHCASVIKEAFESYLGWETYCHGA